MTGWLGNFPEDFTTVTCMFTTHDGNGAPVAPSSAFEAADVIIYKNGSATQKTTTNGVTMTSPFDSIVGLHCVVIDTSNNTGDSGFWTTGGGDVYTILLSPDTETVNAQTALRIIGQFGIDLQKAVGTALTDIQSRLPAALTGAGNMKSDALAMNGNTTAAARLAALGATWISGTLPSQAGVPLGQIKLSDGVILFDTCWNGGTFIVTGGTGAPYFDVIKESVAATDLITMGAGDALPVVLDNTTTFLLINIPGLSAESTANQVAAFWGALRIANNAPGSFGEFIPSDPDLAVQLLDYPDAIETGLTWRQAQRGQVAMLFGVVSGARTGTEVFKNPAGDIVRITITDDSSGNRTVVLATL